MKVECLTKKPVIDVGWQKFIEVFFTPLLSANGIYILIWYQSFDFNPNNSGRWTANRLVEYHLSGQVITYWKDWFEDKYYFYVILTEENVTVPLSSTMRLFPWMEFLHTCFFVEFPSPNCTSEILGCHSKGCLNKVCLIS